LNVIASKNAFSIFFSLLFFFLTLTILITTSIARTTRQTRQASIDISGIDEPSSSNAPMSEANAMETENLGQNLAEETVNRSWSLYGK
jgi:hypothetical protein